MKPPKNFYSNLDRRKQGLPELPEATAADAGKILKVDSQGAWELDNVQANSYTLIELTPGSGVRWNLPNGLTRHDIFTRVVNGEFIIFKSISEITNLIPVTHISSSGSVVISICFANIFYDGSNIKSSYVILDDTNDTYVKVNISGNL